MTHLTEEWKPVVGFEGNYLVSNLGRVQNRRSGQFLRATVASRGYAIVNLVDASRGLRRCSHVYNLVTAAFLGPKPSGLCVNHIDGVKTNNRLDNLEYVTIRENNRHAVAVGLIRRSLSPQEVREVRQLKGHLGVRAVGQLLGISKTTVGNIWRREYYADID